MARSEVPVRAPLDVNVQIALLDADHSLHSRATQWFSGREKRGWATCPITENGCARVMSHPGYPNALPVRAIMQRLAEARTGSSHEF
jgi:predicted nucleic acid-binding protein